MRRIVPLLAAATLVHTASADVVFQADFNGTGSGTGGANDMVTLGGTGQLTTTQDDSHVYPSITSSAPLASGGGSYMSLNDTGEHTGANRPSGATLNPTSAATSFDSWYTDNGTSGFDTLNGGFDFYFRTNIDPALDYTQYYFLSLNNAPQLRLDLFSINNDLRLFLGTNNTTFTAAESSDLEIKANTTYHLASTVETDETTGLITLKLYLAEGNTAIDTSDNTFLIASSTSGSALDDGTSNSITEAFNSADGFNFGQQYNSVDDVKVTDFDQFRIYDAVPEEFSAIPEAGTVATTLGFLAFVSAISMRRKRSN